MLEFLEPFLGYGQWVLRLGIAAVFVVHGLPKMKSPAQTAAIYGAPSFVGWLHGLAEVLGAAALVTGMLMSWGALVLAAIMVGAIFFKAVKWKVPFSASDKAGWEFDLVILGGLLVLLLG